jgi:alpha-L-rhamnosidase
MAKKEIVFLVFLSILFSCNKKEIAVNPPIDLKCENDTSPLGIDHPKPVFGWKLYDTAHGVMQSAYQVIVASTEKLIQEEKGDIWDSEKKLSDQSQFILYCGRPLESAKSYYWAVQVFDSAGNPSGYSKPAKFETGFMNNREWKATWIKSPKILEKHASVLFRKEFELSKKVLSARVYSTGLGAYELFMNGNKVGNQKLAPGWTNFDKRIQYQTFDVTSLLKEGVNAIGVINAKFWPGNDELMFIMQMKIEYDDGSVDWFYSGEGWKAHESPVVHCSYEGGEKYDARNEIPGWNKPGFKDRNWAEPRIENNKNSLVSQQLQPIVVKQELKPVKVFTPDNNRKVFDMGETMPGWVKIRLNEKQGKPIKLRYLTTFNNKDNGAGKVVATDEYICKGSKNEEWEPAFAYHIFRFVEVSGTTSVPDNNFLVGKVAYPDVSTIGYFNCSNELINNIYLAVVRTGRNNLVSMLTGLPDEDSRVGSPVSAQAYAATALYTFDMYRAFPKYIEDLCDLQGTDGRLHFLPGSGNGTFSPGWPDVITVVPLKTFLFTGDRRVLENNYPAIKAWHDSQQRESDAGSPPYMHNREGNGDLYELSSTPVKQIGSTYYFYSTSNLCKISEALDLPDEATTYMELAGFTKDQFNQSFLTYRTARYWAETQTAHLLPLAAGLTPLSHTDRVAGFIAAELRKNETHLTTGVLATQFLLPILSQFKYHELAYKLMTQTTKPSWGYMINKGSSTIWGSWDGVDEASCYQLALASAGEWLYAYLVGIRPDPKFPGFKHSIIDPEPVKHLDKAEARIETLYGRLAVKWEKKGKALAVIVEIPANTWSTLMLPVKKTKTARISLHGIVIINNGKATADCPAYIKFKGFDASMAILDARSGKYEFVVE